MGNEPTKLSNEELRRRQIQKMDTELRRRLQKGVQYNMKVVIRGDKNTGKTSLMRRLQGQEFREEYIPSTQIQTAHIMWNYKVSDDNVKVEVWDVVDRARSRRSSSAGLYTNNHDDEGDNEYEGSRLEHLAYAGSSGRGESMAVDLDASLVDVYKGTHAVIFIFDMQKRWTWDYVTRNINSVPSDLEILILGNFRDEGERRVVSQEDVGNYMSTLDGQRRRHVRYLECSLRNQFGLRQLYTFLNLPFLRLKKEHFLLQMELLDRELASTVEEIDILTAEQDYSAYLELMRETKKRRRLPSLRSTNQPASSATSNTLHSNNPSSPSPPVSQTPSPPVQVSGRGTSSSQQRKTSKSRSPKTQRNKTNPGKHDALRSEEGATHRLTGQFLAEEFSGGDESDTNASTNITTMPYDSDDNTYGKDTKQYDAQEDSDEDNHEDENGMVMLNPTEDIEEDFSSMYVSVPKKTRKQYMNTDSEKSLDQIPARRERREPKPDTLEGDSDQSAGEIEPSVSGETSTSPHKKDDMEEFLAEDDNDDNVDNDENDILKGSNDSESEEEDDENPQMQMSVATALIEDSDEEQQEISITTTTAELPTKSEVSFVPDTEPPVVDLEIPLDDDNFFDDVNDTTPQHSPAMIQDEDEAEEEEEAEEDNDDTDTDSNDQDPETKAKLEAAAAAAAEAAAKMEAELKAQQAEEEENKRKKRRKKEENKEERKKRRQRKPENDGEGEKRKRRKRRQSSKTKEDKDGRRRKKKRRKAEESSADVEE